jgi:hypothetical protein
MAAPLPASIRLSDHISLCVMFRSTVCSRSWPRPARRASASAICRPTSWSVYHVIALALHMSASTGEVRRCLLESQRWL